MSEERAEAGAQPQTRAGMRRTVGMAVLVVALVAGAVWGFGRWRYSRTHVSTDNAQVDAHIVPVLAKVGGYVREIHFDDNQTVQRGELIVVLDDDDLRLTQALTSSSRLLTSIPT